MNIVKNKFTEYIQKYIEGKSVCILGFGREGRATYDILARYCSSSKTAIADLNVIDRAANGISFASISLSIGEGIAFLLLPSMQP